jgi:diguanylate cyclase (GGDEF)-like protein
VAEPLAVKDRVRADLVGLLYQQVPLSSFISALVATVLCALLWDVTQHGLLLAWWCVVAALSAVRAALAFSYRHHAVPKEALRWEMRFLVMLAMTGAVWGVGGWLIMPKGLVAYQAVVYFFLMGMVSGAVANYSAHVVGVMATAILIFLPSTVGFAFEESMLTRAMAFGSVVYVIGAFRTAKMLSKSFERSHRLTYELEIARAEAELQARTDELTQMRNRRAFHEMGEVAVAQARRYRDPLALISLDIDHFKKVNDTWGHATGDETLRLVALIIQRTIRTSDIAGRIGGEELAILLPRASAEQAVAMAERLRIAMEKAPLYHDKGEIHFTASFGVAVMTPALDTLERLLAEADKALYEAKEGGRNRVVSHAAPAEKVQRAKDRRKA